MDLAAGIITVASLSFSAGVAFAAFAFVRVTVTKATHDAALRELEKQRDIIDRLLARHFERMSGDDAEQFGRLRKHKPVEKPK
jgi:hypothetical protein